MNLRQALPFALLLALSACAGASVPWENPSVPKSQWSSDWRSCRRWAENQVGWREGDSSSPFRDYDRAQAKRQTDAIAAGCMVDRGYTPVRSSKK